jgi:hypothetical protein
MSSDRFFLLKAWMALSTAFVAVGWLLSAVGQCNLRAYVISAGVTPGLGISRLARRPVGLRIRWVRFRRGLPLVFSVVGFLAFVGEALHAPNNYDAVTYRLPRLLEWLAAGHWSGLKPPMAPTWLPKDDFLPVGGTPNASSIEAVFLLAAKLELPTLFRKRNGTDTLVGLSDRSNNFRLWKPRTSPCLRGCSGHRGLR